MGNPSQTRRKCQWLPNFVDDRETSDEEKLTGGGSYSSFDHPDLLAAMRGISGYHRWVNDRLIPIVMKWIDENRDSVVSQLTPQQMDDIGAAVEAAFILVEKSEYYEERILAAAREGSSDYEVNPIWTNITKVTLQAEKNVDRNQLKPAIQSDQKTE